VTHIGWTVLALLLAAPAPPGAALEREARQIETMLIAPCCWRQQVSEHQSEAADQVRREIRGMLASGMARQQVLDAFVARYGTRILAEPPDRGFSRLLHVGPWIIGVGTAVGFFFLIRRMRRRPDRDDWKTPAVGAGPTSDDVYAERLDDELRRLD
jgi:cytochrome c-type biogenesis protein CcmH